MALTKVLPDIPDEIIAGDSFSWKKSFSDYPAPTFVLSYVLVNSQTKITIAAIADGADHLVEVDPTTSTAYTAGEYKYQAYVTKGSTERFLIDSGVITIKTNFDDQTSFDDRTHAEKVLDAIEATIEGKASKDQQSYSIAGRSISKFSFAELMEARTNYRAEVKKERRIADRKAGKSGSNKILTRFTAPR